LGTSASVKIVPSPSWEGEAGEPAGATRKEEDRDGGVEKKEEKESWYLIPVRGERSASGRAGPCLHSVRYCQTCWTIWNRDVNAARNIAFMFWWLRGHAGELPPRFRPRRWGDGMKKAAAGVGEETITIGNGASSGSPGTQSQRKV
jgi:hypothetical protein